MGSAPISIPVPIEHADDLQEAQETSGTTPRRRNSRAASRAEELAGEVYAQDAFRVIEAHVGQLRTGVYRGVIHRMSILP